MPKLEQQTQNAIMDYLAVRKIWCRRLNSGAIKVDKRFFRFGSVGMRETSSAPPVKYEKVGQWLMEYPVILWLEVKSDIGRQSKGQIAFMDEVRLAGHHYAVVRSIEDVEAVLKEIQG